MRRSTIIMLGTLFGGIAVYACDIILFGLTPKEPGKTIAFLSSFVIAATVCVFATRRMGKSFGPVERLTIAQMEQKGLLQREKYEARRAFQVREFEDEGCQYFIELNDGSTLFLGGQYLYDYEPMDGARQQARKFPTTEFVVLRDKRDGLIVDVIRSGNVIEPEVEVPSFTRADHESGRAPRDGDIISDRSYDQLKKEWSKSMV
jgi:hypothetical protein